MNVPHYVNVLSLLKDFKTENHPTKNSSMYTGYIDGMEKYESFLGRLKQIGYPFAIRNSDQATSRKVFYSSNFGIINIPFFGSPFMVERSSVQDCVCGKLYYKSTSIVATTEEEYQAEKAKLAEEGVKNRRIQKPSKRINCPAALWTRCIRIFDQPDYFTDEQTASNWRKSKLIRKRLNDDLMKSNPPTSTLRFHIALSAFKEHTHEPIPLVTKRQQKKTRITRANIKSEKVTTIPVRVSQLKENRKRKLVIGDNISNEFQEDGAEGEELSATRESSKVVIINVGRRKKKELTEIPRQPTQRRPKRTGVGNKNAVVKDMLERTENKITEDTQNVMVVNKENADVVIIKRALKKRKPSIQSIHARQINTVIAEIEGSAVPRATSSLEADGNNDEVWEFNVMEADDDKASCEQVEEMTLDVMEEDEHCQVITNLIHDTALRIADLAHLCDDTNAVLLEYYSAMISVEDQMKAHCIQYQTDRSNVLILEGVL